MRESRRPPLFPGSPFVSQADERAFFFLPAPVAVPAGAPVTGAFLKSYLHLHVPSGNPLYKGVPGDRRPAGGRKSLHPSFTAAVAGPTGMPVAPHGSPRRPPRAWREGPVKAFRGPDAPEPPLRRGCVKVKVVFRFPRGAHPREHYSCAREAPPPVTRACPPPADACPPPMSAHWQKNAHRFRKIAHRFRKNAHRLAENAHRLAENAHRLAENAHRFRKKRSPLKNQ